MAELSQTEKALIEHAVQTGKHLTRPFLPREAFTKARAEGYSLKPAFDPRFVRAGNDAAGRPLWIVDEDPERLQRYHMANFFSALSSYAEQCLMQARFQASETLTEAYNRHSGPRPPTKSRDALVREALEEMGWTLGGE